MKKLLLSIFVLCLTNLLMAQLPVADAGKDTIICLNSTIVMDASVSGGIGPLTFIWTPSQDLDDPNILKPTFTASTNGIKSYVLEVTDSLSNVDRDTVIVTIFSPPFAGTGGDVNICIDGILDTLIKYLGGGVDSNGIWSGPTVLTGGDMGIIDPAIAIEGIYKYLVPGSGVCPDDTSELMVNLISPPNAGLDDTISICNDQSSVNLFDSLGGSPDTSGAWWSPSDLTGGHLGSLDPSTASTGVYSYIVPGGLGCANDTSQITVIINKSSDAGRDSVALFCINGSSVDLFGYLGGSPDTGGVWAGPDILTGNYLGTFDPMSNTGGVYSYIVTAGCSNDTSIVTVTVSSGLDAGVDSTVTFCSNSTPGNLFDVLGGSPDTGGVWQGPSILSGGYLGVFDPSTADTGTYNYIVDLIGCPSDTSRVTVSIEAAPNAGTDTLVDFCMTDPTVNLFDLLRGTPAAGGYWVGPSFLPGGDQGTFNPFSNAGGLYTYIVNGAGACMSGSAKVTVTIHPKPDAGIDAAIIVCNSSSPVNLIDVLNGTPDMGGLWIGPDTLGGGDQGTFDPFSDDEGTYYYVVLGYGQCVNDTSKVVVTTSVVGFAGLDGSLNICPYDTVMDLVDSLGGAPDFGGTWVGPSTLAGGDKGTFDPKTDQPGTYYYLVTGGPGCPNDTAKIEVTFGTGYSSISGKVNYIDTNTICADVHVYAYRQTVGIKMVLEGVDTVAPDGSYSINNLPSGEYLIWAERNNNCPDVVSSYLGDYPRWMDGHRRALYCDEVGLDIMLSKLPNLTGGASINGEVQYGNSSVIPSQPGDPYDGLDICLVDRTTKKAIDLDVSGTGGAGKFQFNDVPLGDYYIHIDITGVPIDTNTIISVGAATVTIEKIVAIVDSNFISINMGVGLNKLLVDNEQNLQLFPNPAIDQFTVQFTLGQQQDVRLQVFNVLGQLVFEQIKESVPLGSHYWMINKLSTQGEGIYFVKLITSTEEFSRKLIMNKEMR